jgi:Domain of unknown function (DUF4259)
MGTWDASSFGNDDAMDWVFTLQESDTLAPIADALDAADAEYLEAPDADVITAAAETLVALAGQPSDALPAEVQEWVAGHAHLDGRPLRDQAIRALARVTAPNSEIVELWTESGEDAEWRANIGRLGTALSEVEFAEPAPAPQVVTAQVASSRPWWKFWG